MGALIVDACKAVAYRNHTLALHVPQQSPADGEGTTSPLRGIHLSSFSKTAQSTLQHQKSNTTSSDVLEAKSVSHVSVLVIVNGILYALLLSGVAINFPSGVIVGFLYFPLYLLGLLR